MFHIKSASFLLASLVMGGSAMATVSFNPSSGSGFVGKGDVQNAFGWNNGMVQSQANIVGFQVEQNITVHATCEALVTQGSEKKASSLKTKIISKKQNIQATVETAVDSSNRLNKNSRTTGFFLNGYSSYLGANDVDLLQVGGRCTLNGDKGNEISGTYVSVTHTPQAIQLFVVVNGDKRLLMTY